MMEKKKGKYLTPMMKQYFEIKNRYENYIVFYRMGDFYEMFDKDAEIASSILNIVLTKRAGIKMCGVPYHSYKTYLKKLIDAQKKVVICEQLEDPKKAKGLVKRGVTEIITPGTVLNDEFLSNDNNFIFSIYEKNGIYYSAWADISTGDFYISDYEKIKILLTELKKINPKEIILSESQKGNIEVYLDEKIEVTILPDSYFNEKKSEEILKDFFNVNTLKFIDPSENKYLITPAASLILYFLDNEVLNLQHFNNLKYINNKNYLYIDNQTFTNLEIFDPLFQSEKNTSLISIFNKTKTPMGNRTLKNYFRYPLNNGEKINKRLNDVECFYNDYYLSSNIILKLKEVKDIERIIVKILNRKILPQDFVKLSSSLFAIKEIESILVENGLKIINISDRILEYSQKIDKAFEKEFLGNIDGGGYIKEGYDKLLDKYRYVENNSNNLLVEYQQQEKEKTNIQNLKIKYNKISGYFFEVSKGNLTKVPDYFIRKQTLTNSERFTTEKLIQYESEIKNAIENRIKREKEILDTFIEEGKLYIKELKNLSYQIGYLDFIVTIAEISRKYKFTRPVFTDENVLEIKEGRHPVVEISLKKEFIPNDLYMSENNYFHLVTGPNMSGKSTYLRQNALIIFLAHVGSFVPAKYVKLHIFDKLFSRVGASDNIAKGESTFLLEMSETANILNNATSKSFVILDEVGRGTATFDGMSLAYAISEYIIKNIRCKTLFATHYYELTSLDENKGVENYKTSVKEWKNKIIFLKKITKGAADRSYGIYVAQIAGIPKEVIDRAKVLLKELEKNEIKFEYKITKKNPANINKQKKENLLFDPYLLEEEKIVEKIKKINIETITPIEAFNILVEFKKIIEKHNL